MRAIHEVGRQHGARVVFIVPPVYKSDRRDSLVNRIFDRALKLVAGIDVLDHRHLHTDPLFSNPRSTLRPNTIASSPTNWPAGVSVGSGCSSVGGVSKVAEASWRIVADWRGQLAYCTTRTHLTLRRLQIGQGSPTTRINLLTYAPFPDHPSWTSSTQIRAARPLLPWLHRYI